MRCEKLIHKRLSERFDKMTKDEVDRGLMGNQLQKDNCPYCGIVTFQIVVTPSYVPTLIKKN